MDPRERADAALARARARGAFVVTPEDAISPMDAANTLQIPRTLVTAIDRSEDDPESTMIVPYPAPPGHQQGHSGPPQPQQRPPQQAAQPWQQPGQSQPVQQQAAQPQPVQQQPVQQQPVQQQPVQQQAVQQQAVQQQAVQQQQRGGEPPASAPRPRADTEWWPPEPNRQPGEQTGTGHRPVQPQPVQPQPVSPQPVSPQPQQLDGLVPTTKQPPPPDHRPSLTQRLDGQRRTLG